MEFCTGAPHRKLPAMKASRALSWIRLPVGAGLVALAGCSSVGELQMPAPPVASTWPQTQMPTPSPDTRGVAQVHWRSFFADPRLQSLIAAALEHNRDLRIAVARVQEARAQYGVVNADRKPNVSLIGSGSFSKSPGDLNANGVPISGEHYDLSLAMVSFEADLWGRLSGLSEAAKSQVLATQAAQRTVQITLIADVASAYFALLQFEEMAGLAKSTLRSRELTLDLVTRGREAGGVPESEVQQAVAILESARSAFDSLEYQRAVAFNRLQFLVGDMPKDLPDGNPLGLQSASVRLPDGLPADVLLLRPDVMAAEYRLRAAHANVGAARAAFLPRILLTAGAGVASAGLSSLFQAGSWTFQPTVSMPLLDGGRTASGRDLAEARKDIAIAEYEKSLQQAFREVSDLLAASTSGQRQLRAALASESAQKYRLEAAVARNMAGLGSHMDVLDAEREMLAARQETLRVRRVQLDNAAQLYRALGGGAAEQGSQMAQVQ